MRKTDGIKRVYDRMEIWLSPSLQIGLFLKTQKDKKDFY